MKKAIIIFIFFISALSVWAQMAPVVGIMSFETGAGVTPAEAATATSKVIDEMNSWESLTVLTGDDAKNADYVIRGQVSRQNNRLILTATTTLRSNNRLLNNSRAEGAAMNAVPFEDFCGSIAENIPLPNYLLGKWRSSLTTSDGPITCILEFKTGGVVNVIQYDTWEHKGTNSLKYQGIGGGTYTYAGYVKLRTVTVGGRQIQYNATVGVNLDLEDALPKYVKLNIAGLRVLFDDDSKSSFQLVSGVLPCGDNYAGASVYPTQEVYYTRFTKTQ